RRRRAALAGRRRLPHRPDPADRHRELHPADGHHGALYRLQVDLAGGHHQRDRGRHGSLKKARATRRRRRAMEKKRRVGSVGLLALPLALALPGIGEAAPARPGDFLVIDLNAGTGGHGALFTVSPATGSRTILSDFGDAIQGPTGGNPASVILDADGAILVIDPNAGTGANGALFTVDPVTGSRTILSDFGDVTQGRPGRTHSARPRMPPAPSLSSIRT